MHLKVAATIQDALAKKPFRLLLDPACGGNQHLPLFISEKKCRATRMCCVDILILKNEKVRAIIEIEESGFLPTKICGKYLQAAIADHFIHASHTKALPYDDKVTFIQILDGSKSLKSGSQKEEQAMLIADKINKNASSFNIQQYLLFYIKGSDDTERLDALCAAIKAL